MNLDIGTIIQSDAFVNAVSGDYGRSNNPFKVYATITSKFQIKAMGGSSVIDKSRKKV